MTPPPLPPSERLPDGPPSLPPNDRHSAGPPPLPTINEDALVTGIAGAEGLNHRQVLEEIGRGGRFVVFLYAISLLIITFRRSTSVRFVRAGETVGADAWGPTLLTLVTGWWGIPWGPIYSVQSIFQNAMGGKDVTEALLAPLVGTERAKAALRLRPKPKAGLGLWSLRAMLLAIPCAVTGMLSLGAWVETQREREVRQLPGYGAGQNACAHLDGRADGNSPDARAAAVGMKAVFDSSFKMEGRDGKAKPSKPFGVWCEFHGTDSVVLVQWDHFRRVPKSDRAELDAMLWQTACMAADSAGTGSLLTVGIKGQFQWDGAYIGKLPEPGKIAEAKPEQIITGIEVEGRLISAFAPVMTR